MTQVFPVDQTWALWRDLDLGCPKRDLVQEEFAAEVGTIRSQGLKRYS